MKILIAGIDGYLGWSLAVHMASLGHTIGGIDLGLRRQWVSEVGSWSAIPIPTLTARKLAFRQHFGKELFLSACDLRNFEKVSAVMQKFTPDTIVHMGECPSAPYSMKSVEHATFVQLNNIATTFNVIFAVRYYAPSAHIVKIGTMGEYGTPNIDIAEGHFDIQYRGRTDRLPFPRQANSWYHWSKVHGSNNLMFACQLWGLTATDVMQGIVYGTKIDAMSDCTDLVTRFDFDECFGTCVNRFCAQAVIGQPLLIYGGGQQRRGFIALRDSMQCLQLAILNPPAPGEYRVLNQFDEVYSISQLGREACDVAKNQGISAECRVMTNPRMERQEHHYAPACEKLRALGFAPCRSLRAEIAEILTDLEPFRNRILEKQNVLLPTVHWR